jgi:hypothetical protein
MDLESVKVDGLQPRPRPPRWPQIVAAVGLLLALAAGGYFLWFGEDEKPEPTSPPEAMQLPSPAPPQPAVRQPPKKEVRPPETSGRAPAPEPEVPIPALDESDPLLRALARGVSTNPQLSSWLVTQGLVRRFTVAIDNIAEGRSPRSHLLFLAPESAFKISRRKQGEEDERLFVDATSYQRYNSLAEVFASLDTNTAVEIYRRVEPLVDEAYRELGVPDENFDERLSKAFNVLLATPIVEGEIELEPLIVTYAYADPELEDLAPVQRHFLRMGPRNVALVQEKLREIAAALGL